MYINVKYWFKRRYVLRRRVAVIAAAAAIYSVPIQVFNNPLG